MKNTLSSYHFYHLHISLQHFLLSYSHTCIVSPFLPDQIFYDTQLSVCKAFVKILWLCIDRWCAIKWRVFDFKNHKFFSNSGFSHELWNLFLKPPTFGPSTISQPDPNTQFPLKFRHEIVHRGRRKNDCATDVVFFSSGFIGQSWLI